MPNRLSQRLVASGLSSWLDSPSRVRAFLFATIFAVLVFSRVTHLADSNYSMLTSQSILTHHTPALNGYDFTGLGTPYQLAAVHGRILYNYPHASSVLSLPFVALMNALGISAATPDGRPYLKGEMLIQKLLAGFLMAALTCVFFESARLFLPLSSSLTIALASALGTQIWSIASRAMWSHTWLIFLLGLVTHSLLAAEVGAKRWHPVWVATLLSWAFFVRPASVVPLTAITAYIVLSRKPRFLSYAATGAAWLAGFLAYNWLTFDDLLPRYYHFFTEFGVARFGTAFAGLLFSPMRGLFVFDPIFAFVLYLTARNWQAIPQRGLAILSMIVITAQIVCVALWPDWWGGWSYGPRLLTDTVPWFVMLAILACKPLADVTTSAGSGRNALSILNKVTLLAGCALLAVSVTLNGIGANSWRAIFWDVGQVNAKGYPDRTWDWTSPSFLAVIPARHP